MKDFKEIDVVTNSFGQGISVSAIQLVRAYAAIANGGLLVEPSIVKEDLAKRGLGERVLSQKAANLVANILFGVTEDEDGTGRKAAIAEIRVVGKTGTAQKASANGRGYDANKVFSSFIGFVDGKDIGVNRKIVMFVAVDEPGVVPRWGGVVAAPVFRRGMERISPI